MRFEDVTATLRGASAVLPCGGMIHGPTFDLQAAMHAVELMDPKLDTHAAVHAVPSILDRLRDGSLPLTTLSCSDVASIMDVLLELEASWRGGNSFPQSLAGCLYTHPLSLHALRTLHAYDSIAVVPDVSVTEYTCLTEGSRMMRSPHDAEHAAVAAHVRGMTPHTPCATLALLSYVTAVLKSMHFAHAAVLRAALADEEQHWPLLYGADLAHGVSISHVFQLLFDAEQAVLQSACAPRCGPWALDAPWFHAHALTPSGGEVDPARAALLARLRSRRATLVAMVCLSPGASAPALHPLVAGRRYPLDAAALACAAAVEQLELARATSPLLTPVGEDDVVARGSVPGVFQGYERQMITGQPPRVVPLAGIAQAFKSSVRALVNLHTLCMLPRIISFNPLRAYTPAPEGAPSLSLTALAGIASRWQEDGVTPTAALLPSDFPFSGVMDGPVAWPGVTGGASRHHASLDALIDALLAFSKRAPDAYVLALASRIVLEVPQRTGEAQNPWDVTRLDHSNSADFATHAVNAARASGVVFGTHTLQELMRASIRDHGVHEEMLCCDDVDRLVFMMDKPLQQLFRLLFGSRLRLRRRLDNTLRDWAVIVTECDWLDTAYQDALARRLRVADEAWIENAISHPRGGKGKAAAAAASSSDGAALLPQDEHAHLVALAQTASMCSLLNWAVLAATRLILTHMDIGVEGSLYHIDEGVCLYWHMEYMFSHMLRHARGRNMASQLRDSVPPCSRMTAATAKLRMEGTGWRVVEDTATPTDAASAAGEPAPDTTTVAAAAPSAPSAPTAVTATEKRGKKGAANAERRRVEAVQAAASDFAEAREAWMAPYEAAIQAACSVPALYTREQDIFNAQQCVCRGLFRVQAALQSAGLIRGLHPHTGASSDSSMRRPHLVYEHRFREYRTFTKPAPLSYADFVHAFSSCSEHRPGFVQELLGEANIQFQTARVYAMRVVAHAKACLSGNSKALPFRSSGPPEKLDKAAAAKVRREQEEKERKRAELRTRRCTPEEIMSVQDAAAPVVTDVLFAARDLATGTRLVRIAIANAAVTAKLLVDNALAVPRLNLTDTERAKAVQPDCSVDPVYAVMRIAVPPLTPAAQAAAAAAAAALAAAAPAHPTVSS